MAVGENFSRHFEASAVKIRLCTFYTCLITGVPTYCTWNFKPFRLKMKAWRRIFRSRPFLNLPSLEAKYDYAPFILFSSMGSPRNARDCSRRSVPNGRRGGVFFDHPCSFGCQNQLCCAAHYYPTLLPVLSSIKSPHPPCLRPYHLEHTSSRPITEVKQGWAVLVLGWVTAWEYTVL